MNYSSDTEFKISPIVMEWFTSSCYAGSLVIYLVVKFYYENEVKKFFDNSGCCGCTVCCREQSPHQAVNLPSPPAGTLLHVSSRRSPLRVPPHFFCRQDERYAYSRRQRSHGER